MHKLAKGLKKKKKKKDKKAADDEDFDHEELERYKRERAEAQQKQLETATGETEEGSKAGNAEAGSDEWKKYLALTAGVDSILQKTHSDLDRIKSTSFFQRKPVESEIKLEADAASDAQAQSKSKKWTNFDKDGNPIEGGDDFGDEEFESKNTFEKAIVDIPDDEDEHEDSVEEDIFDTTYIDVLQNIDVQLAYIPDSPTEELDDDPFDTTNADKVLKTVDKKTGKKLLSLGNAVEVLAGRIDHVSTCKIGRNRRPQNVDLLLDESGENIEAVATANETDTVEPVTKTLLDDDEDLPDVPIDLTQLPPVLPRPVTPVTEVNGTTETTEIPPIDLSEFEVLKEKTILEEIPDLEEDEFDLDAEVGEKIILDETEDPFAEKESENPNLQDEIVEVSFEAKSNAEGEDPFDTTFAANILPGKTELKFIEKELEELPISEVSISLTDPAGLKRDYETGLLKLTEETAEAKKHDLLGSSSTDLSQLTDQPIAPVEELTYVDPFDTSAVQELPQSKVELKFLEKELLGDTPNLVQPQILNDLDDDDFDPRKEEEPPVVVTQSRKASRPEVLDLASTKTVEFILPTPSNQPDLLTTSEEEKNIPVKPLTPYYSQKSLEETLPEEEDEEEIDPFDTNFVAQIAPGKTELKLLESELLAKQEPTLKRVLSDHEFDPRAGEIKETKDYLCLDGQNVEDKVLTPQHEDAFSEEDIDPFDTSFATIAPTKTELKLLESELVSK